MSGKVRFWMPFKGDAGMDAMLADFNKTYPNIQVELTTYNNNSDGNLSVNTSIMSGEVDVLGSFGLSSTWKRWDNAMFEDLTDKFEAEGIDLVANWGTDVFKYNDCIYTLPCGGMSYYISVNMTAWNAAGLGDLPTEWTWDEYLDASRKMTKSATDGSIEMYGGSDYHSVACFTYPRYQVVGHDAYYNDDGTASSFDSDMIVNSLQRELDAEAEKIWFPKSVYRSDNLQAQMTFTGTSQPQVASIVAPNMVRFLRDTTNYPVDWVTGFAPYPVEEKGQKNYMSGVSVYSHAGICTGCQDEAASWAFLKWYSTYGSKYLALAGHMSTWKGTDAGDLVSLIFGSEADAQKLVDVDSFKRVVGVTENPAFVDTFLTAYADVTSALNEYALYAFNGEMNAKDAMAGAAEAANAAITAAL